MDTFEKYAAAKRVGSLAGFEKTSKAASRVGVLVEEARFDAEAVDAVKPYLDLKMDKDLTLDLDARTVTLDPIDFSDPTDIINGCDMEDGDYWAAFGQVNKVQNGLWQINISDAGVVTYSRPPEYYTGVTYEANSIRVAGLDGDENVGVVYVLSNTVLVDTGVSDWKMYVGDATRVPAGTKRRGPTQARSGFAVPIDARDVATDAALIKDAKAWRDINLPIPAIIKARPRLSWAAYPRDPWNMGQMLTLALRDEDVLIWDRTLRIRNALSLNVSNKRIIVEMDPGLPQLVTQHPDMAALTLTGSDIRIEGTLGIKALIPLITTNTRSALTIGAGSKRWNIDGVRVEGGFRIGVVNGVSGSGTADIEDVRIGKLTTRDIRQQALWFNGVALTTIRRVEVEQVDLETTSVDTAAAAIRMGNYVEDVGVAFRGGRVKGGYNAVKLDGSTVPAKGVRIGSPANPLMCDAQEDDAFTRAHGEVDYSLDIRSPKGKGVVITDSSVSGGAGPRGLSLRVQGAGKSGYENYSSEYGQELRSPRISGCSALAIGVYAGIYLDYACDNLAITGAGYSGNIKDGVKAFGTVTSSSNPGANTTFTLNGSVFTFKDVPTTDHDVQRDPSSRDISLQNLLNVLRASADTEARKCTFALTNTSTLRVTYRTPGTAGNAITLAKTWTTGAVTPTLSGGVDPTLTQSKGIDNRSGGAGVSAGSMINTAGNIA